MESSCQCLVLPLESIIYHLTKAKVSQWHPQKHYHQLSIATTAENVIQTGIAEYSRLKKAASHFVVLMSIISYLAKQMEFLGVSLYCYTVYNYHTNQVHTNDIRSNTKRYSNVQGLRIIVGSRAPEEITGESTGNGRGRWGKIPAVFCPSFLPHLGTFGSLQA